MSEGKGREWYIEKSSSWGLCVRSKSEQWDSTFGKSEDAYIASRLNRVKDAQDIVKCVNGWEALESERDSLKRTVDELREAMEGLLDGLDSNGDPERGGLSQEQREKRIQAARRALAKSAEVGGGK